VTLSIVDESEVLWCPRISWLEKGRADIIVINREDWLKMPMFFKLYRSKEFLCSAKLLCAVRGRENSLH
jgi:hypothetical protein